MGSKLSKNINAAQQVYQPTGMTASNPANLPISSRSNRNGTMHFANSNSRQKNSRHNLGQKVPTPKAQ